MQAVAGSSCIDPALLALAGSTIHSVAIDALSKLPHIGNAVVVGQARLQFACLGTQSSRCLLLIPFVAIRM